MSSRLMPHAKLRPTNVPRRRLQLGPRSRSAAARMNLSRLLKCVFDTNIQRCRHGGDALSIIAAIEEPRDGQDHHTSGLTWFGEHRNFTLSHRRPPKSRHAHTNESRASARETIVTKPVTRPEIHWIPIQVDRMRRVQLEHGSVANILIHVARASGANRAKSSAMPLGKQARNATEFTTTSTPPNAPTFGAARASIFALVSASLLRHRNRRTCNDIFPSTRMWSIDHPPLFFFASTVTCVSSGSSISR